MPRCDTIGNTTLIQHFIKIRFGVNKEMRLVGGLKNQQVANFKASIGEASSNIPSPSLYCNDGSSVGYTEVHVSCRFAYKTRVLRHYSAHDAKSTLSD